MKKSLTTLCLLAAILAAKADGTRGIGLYPGSPSEYYAPTVSWNAGNGQLNNIALHRVAYASSTLDYNHVAHLVTDGLYDQREPATLSVSTPDGVLPRKEAEWAVDGGKYSRNILMGSHSWLQYDWDDTAPDICPAKLKILGMAVYDDKVATKGYGLRVQTSTDGKYWQTIGEQKGSGLPGELLHYKLHSDPNKQENRTYCLPESCKRLFAWMHRVFQITCGCCLTWRAWPIGTSAKYSSLMPKAATWNCFLHDSFAACG